VEAAASGRLTWISCSSAPRRIVSVKASDRMAAEMSPGPGSAAGRPLTRRTTSPARSPANSARVAASTPSIAITPARGPAARIPKRPRCAVSAIGPGATRRTRPFARSKLTAKEARSSEPTLASGRAMNRTGGFSSAVAPIRIVPSSRPSGTGKEEPTVLALPASLTSPESGISSCAEAGREMCPIDPVSRCALKVRPATSRSIDGIPCPHAAARMGFPSGSGRLPSSTRRSRSG
jgi:hypothetical protein